jgi:hypothetical protein
VTELQMRFDVYRAKGIPLQMSAASLSAIRATVEATMIREIQRHPFKKQILHVDFQELVAGEKVTIETPDKANAVYLASLAFPLKDTAPEYAPLVVGNFLFGGGSLSSRLGNRVRQLHVHVLARFVSDAAWPGPVWGAGSAQPYPPHMAAVTGDRIAAALQPFGLREIA